MPIEFIAAAETGHLIEALSNCREGALIYINRKGKCMLGGKSIFEDTRHYERRQVAIELVQRYNRPHREFNIKVIVTAGD